MKNKILSLVIIAILVSMLFILTGCSNNTDVNSEDGNSENNTEIEEKNSAKLTPKRDMSDYDTLYWGYVDENDNWVIEPQYRTASTFAKNGLAVVSVHKDDKSIKYGYINENNEVVLDLIYDEAQPFSENGYAGVSLDGNAGIINSNGEFVCSFENVWYAAYCEGTNLVKVVKEELSNREYAFYDLNGNQVTEYKYWEAMMNGIITTCYRGYVQVCDKDTQLYGLLDKDGNVKLECKYKTMLYYSDEELWLVSDENGKYFINENGEKIKDW